MVGFVVFVREHTTATDPRFQAASVEGLLKSDPGLLYYVSRQVVEAGGGLPPELRADPRVQHPASTDLLGEFTVGQEFLVAWAHLATGERFPLHRVAGALGSLWSACGLLAAYLLASAALGRRTVGLVAALLFVLLPANYRTLGFLLMREDLSWPLFALHLGCLARGLALTGARAARVWWLAAGLTLAGSLAAWHAAGFLLGLELACLWGLAVVRGRLPLRFVSGVDAHRWLVVLPPVLAAVCVPALARQGVLVSPVAIPIWGLALAALVQRIRSRGAGPVSREEGDARGLLLGSTVAVGLLLLLTRGTGGGYEHVYEVLAAKLRHAGRFPYDDPTRISFDARLLWQGPFETLPVGWFVSQHAGVLLAATGACVVLGLRALEQRRERDEGGDETRGSAWSGALLFALLVALLAAWCFERLQILPGLLLPVVVALGLARCAPRLAVAGLVLVLLVQGTRFTEFVRTHRIGWYDPAWRQDELARLVDWAREGLEPGAAVVGDFVSSTALLAHLDTPIVLQPKYETAASRERARAFFETFFHGTPQELRRLVRERFQARYLLVDRYTLWDLGRMTGGLPFAVAGPSEGSAAAALLHGDPSMGDELAGYELVYRAGGTPSAEPLTSDVFRVYVVD